MTSLEKIEYLLRQDSMDGWTRNFCNSLGDQLDVGRTLSERQVEILDAKYEEHGPAARAENSAWAESWDSEKEERFRICALYYQGTGYYSSLAQQVSADGVIAEGFIPSKREYHKMCNNKYALKVLAAWFSEPKFPAGSLVAIRATAPRRTLANDLIIKHRDGKPIAYFVLETNSSTPTSASAGAKKYKILAAGSTAPIEVEEKHLKKMKKR